MAVVWLISAAIVLAAVVDATNSDGHLWILRAKEAFVGRAAAGKTLLTDGNVCALTHLAKRVAGDVQVVRMGELRED